MEVLHVRKGNASKRYWRCFHWRDWAAASQNEAFSNTENRPCRDLFGIRLRHIMRNVVLTVGGEIFSEYTFGHKTLKRRRPAIQNFVVRKTKDGGELKTLSYSSHSENSVPSLATLIFQNGHKFGRGAALSQSAQGRRLKPDDITRLVVLVPSRQDKTGSGAGAFKQLSLAADYDPF